MQHRFARSAAVLEFARETHTHPPERRETYGRDLSILESVEDTIELKLAAHVRILLLQVHWPVHVGGHGDGCLAVSMRIGGWRVR